MSVYVGGRWLVPRVCVFFPVNAKKAKKIRGACVCVRACRAGSCASVVSPFLHGARLFPVSTLRGGNGGSDIWEQFLSAPAKVVKGLISSHAGAQKKNGFLQELNTIYPSRQVFQDGRQA